MFADGSGCAAKTRPSGRRSGGSSLLPHEILLQIFEGTQPNSQYECNTSVVVGPQNPWLKNVRTKKALTLVCRAWCGPATRLLYADIVIRRMGQVAALARTFREDRSADSLSHLVRKVTLDACIVVPTFAEVVREDLELILQACTHLRSFSSHAADGFCGGDPLSPMRDIDYFTVLGIPSSQRIKDSLRVREFHLVPPEACFEWIIPLLSFAICLTSLILNSSPGWIRNELESDGLPSLCLPSLENLQLPFDSQPTLGFKDYVRSRWRLPALRALTLVDCDEPSAHGILEAHGAEIKYLHFHNSPYPDLLANSTAPPTVYTQLARLCPAIEHLVVPAAHAISIDIHSSTLRYLDVLNPRDTGPPSAFALRYGYRPRVPKITLSRAAHAPLLTSTRYVLFSWTFLPRACHPSLITVDEPDMQIAHSFHYCRIIQTRVSVMNDREASSKDLYYEDGESQEVDESEDEWEGVDLFGGRAKKDKGSRYEPSSGSDDVEETSDDDSWCAFGDEQGLPQDYEEDAELQTDRDAARRFLLERFSLSHRCAFLRGGADQEDENEQEPEGAERQTSVEGQDGGYSTVMM